MAAITFYERIQWFFSIAQQHVEIVVALDRVLRIMASASEYHAVASFLSEDA